MIAARDRWAETAPICRQYARLREDLSGEDRSQLWEQFVEDLEEAGVEPSGWASPEHA